MRKVLLGLIGLVLLLSALGLGGYFAAKRPDLPYEALETAYASPASKFLDLGDGLTVHYRDEGAQLGRTVLLVHGFSASLHTWEPWVRELSGAHRLVSIDLPGHGLTRTPVGYTPSMEAYADTVAQVIEELNLPSLTVVGSSMGGNVAWQLALRHPDKVEGLVLVAASGWPDPRVAKDPKDDPAVFRLMRDPFWGPVMRDLDSTALTRQGLRASFADPALATDEMVARYVTLSRAPGRRTLILKLSTDVRDRTPATPERMAQIKTPTLVLHGEKDAIVPMGGGRRFAETIPGAKAHFYPNAGHIPQEEIPTQSAADLAAFLASLPAPAPRSGAPVADPAAAVAAPAGAEAKPAEGVY